MPPKVPPGLLIEGFIAAQRLRRSRRAQQLARRAQETKESPAGAARALDHEQRAEEEEGSEQAEHSGTRSNDRHWASDAASPNEQSGVQVEQAEEEIAATLIQRHARVLLRKRLARSELAQLDLGDAAGQPKKLFEPFQTSGRDGAQAQTVEVLQVPSGIGEIRGIRGATHDKFEDASGDSSGEQVTSRDQSQRQREHLEEAAAKLIQRACTRVVRRRRAEQQGGPLHLQQNIQESCGQDRKAHGGNGVATEEDTRPALEDAQLRFCAQKEAAAKVIQRFLRVFQAQKLALSPLRESGEWVDGASVGLEAERLSASPQSALSEASSFTCRNPDWLDDPAGQTASESSAGVSGRWTEGIFVDELPGPSHTWARSLESKLPAAAAVAKTSAQSLVSPTWHRYRIEEQSSSGENNNKVLPLKSPQEARCISKDHARRLIAEATARREAQTKRLQHRSVLRDEEEEGLLLHKQGEEDCLQQKENTEDILRRKGQVQESIALALVWQERQQARMQQDDQDKRIENGVLKAQALFRGKQAREQTEELRLQHARNIVAVGQTPPLQLSSRSPQKRDNVQHRSHSGSGSAPDWNMQGKEEFWRDGETEKGAGEETGSSEHEMHAGSNQPEEAIVKVQALFRSKQARARATILRQQQEADHGEVAKTIGASQGTNTQKLGAMLGGLLASTLQKSQQLSNEAFTSDRNAFDHRAGYLFSDQAATSSPTFESEDLIASSFLVGPQENQVSFISDEDDDDPTKQQYEENQHPFTDFASPYGMGLLSKGLHSNPLASRADDGVSSSPVEGGGMQHIYEGLEEANSILERMCNRHIKHSTDQLDAQRILQASAEQAGDWIEECHAEKLPIILDVYSQSSLNPSHTSSLRREADPYSLCEIDDPGQRPAQERKKKTIEWLDPESQHLNAVTRAIKAAMSEKEHGGVAWFLDLDQDGDGYVAVNALIDAVRLLPCRLSTHQALEFAASLHTDMLGDEECVTLDSLWVALHRPSIHEQTESQLPFTPSSDSGSEENKGYSYYMPEMTRLQFGTEVQDMSRAAALKLSSIGKRCAELEHVIRSEQVSNSKCSFYTTCQQLTFRGCLGLHSA